VREVKGARKGRTEISRKRRGETTWWTKRGLCGGARNNRKKPPSRKESWVGNGGGYTEKFEIPNGWKMWEKGPLEGGVDTGHGAGGLERQAREDRRGWRKANTRGPGCTGRSVQSNKKGWERESI